MKKLPLTDNMYAMVDNNDYVLLSKHKWAARKDCRNFYAYRRVITKGKRRLVLMHRLIMNPPKNMQVDHINGNGLDNRRKNLRICTQSENQQNSYKHRAGRLLGTHRVFINGGKYKYWQAATTIKRKQVYIGSAKTEKEAHQLYLDFIKINKLKG